MSVEIDILRDVTARLSQAEIPFMLTGSMAMNAYAEPRMTRDVDIIIESSPGGASRLMKAFSDGYYIDADSVTHALAGEGMFNAIHQEWVFKVDCIVRKSSQFRRLEFQRRRRLRGFRESLSINLNFEAEVYPPRPAPPSQADRTF